MPRRKVIRNIEVPIGPSIAYIPLTKGLFALIDREDVDRCQPYTWTAMKTGYAQTCLNYTHFTLHRFLLAAPDGVQVDHRDNSRRLDNRVRCGQIRLATRSQNQCNRGPNRNGLKGIWLYKPNGKWAATIQVNGKKICLGYFFTPEEAHAAYCAASKRYHGKFGRTA